MERRKFTRVSFDTMAAIKSRTRETNGNVENLSLNGMFLLTDRPEPINEPLEIKIYLSGSSSEIFIGLKGRVVRQREDGIAIQFDMANIDVDALTILRYILAYNGMTDEQVLKEYSDFIERRDAIS